MDNNIYQVVAKGVEPAEVKVESEAHKAYPSTHIFSGEKVNQTRKFRNMDKGIFLNNLVIKDKIAVKTWPVEQKGNTAKENGNEKNINP